MVHLCAMAHNWCVVGEWFQVSCVGADKTSGAFNLRSDVLVCCVGDCHSRSVKQNNTHKLVNMHGHITFLKCAVIEDDHCVVLRHCVWLVSVWLIVLPMLVNVSWSNVTTSSRLDQKPSITVGITNDKKSLA